MDRWSLSCVWFAHLFHSQHDCCMPSLRRHTTRQSPSMGGRKKLNCMHSQIHTNHHCLQYRKLVMRSGWLCEGYGMDACTLKQEYSQILIAMPTGEGMCILSRLCLNLLEVDKRINKGRWTTYTAFCEESFLWT